MDGEIEPAELTDRLDDDTDRRIVDIRNPTAFERGHIPGADNVPLQQLPERVDTLRDADHVVTVCPHGKASVKAARLIGSFEGTDATVESLAGGLDAWEGPLETPAAAGEPDEGPTGTDTTTTDADGGSEAPF